jgi:UDP-glucose 4-epimerase
VRILVTGGAGYIGSVVVKALLEGGHHVVVLDNLQTGHREAVVKGAEFVLGDLADLGILRDVMRKEKTEAVIHFAAEALVGESMENPSKFFRTNICYGVNLLDDMVGAEVRKIVFSSSAATYGEPERTPIKEEYPTIPTNPYGESKLAFEKILRWYDNIHGVQYVALRYFNAAGAAGPLGEDHSPETHLVPLVLRAALGSSPAVTVNGDDYDTPDGTCIRDYTHVLDLASAHIRVLEEVDSRVYNVGTGKGHSVKEVIAAAERVTGRRIPVQIGNRRPGDPARLVADGGRIQRELNWKPEHSELEEILESAWTWLLEHPNGYGSAPGSSTAR